MGRGRLGLRANQQTERLALAAFIAEAVLGGILVLAGVYVGALRPVVAPDAASG